MLDTVQPFSTFFQCPRLLCTPPRDDFSSKAAPQGSESSPQVRTRRPSPGPALALCFLAPRVGAHARVWRSPALPTARRLARQEHARTGHPHSAASAAPGAQQQPRVCWGNAKDGGEGRAKAARPLGCSAPGRPTSITHCAFGVR